MTMEEALDRICPAKDEDEVMEEIQGNLSGEGFAITNFNKGGIFYHLIRIFVTIYVELKEFARTVISNSTVSNADEDWLEIKAPDFGKARKQAVKAQGYVTIIRDDYENALQVTKGHTFKTLPDADGVEKKFYVLETSVIEAGAETGRVLVEAEESGTAYNLPAGKITVSMIHLEGVSAVTNEEDWLYLEGSEIEEVEAFRERILGSWSAAAELTTEDKLKNAASAVSGVIHVEVDAQHPRGQGTTDIIITGSNGEATEELLRRVEEATAYLKGNYDDFLYRSSTIVRQDIHCKVYIAKDDATDGVAETASAIIERMMQLSGRSEMNCLYLDDVRYVLKSGIQDYKRTEFEEPAADIELATGNVVMLGDLQVTVENVGGA
jgi:uncharacterized phage protein gp47/JayE